MSPTTRRSNVRVQTNRRAFADSLPFDFCAIGLFTLTIELTSDDKRRGQVCRGEVIQGLLASFVSHRGFHCAENLVTDSSFAQFLYFRCRQIEFDWRLFNPTNDRAF